MVRAFHYQVFFGALLSAIIIAVFCSGCVSYTRDVSSSSKAWGGYHHLSQYELLHDVYLVTVNTDVIDLALVPDRTFWSPSRIYDLPDFDSSPESPGVNLRKNHSAPARVVKKGTHIRGKKVLLLRGINWWAGWRHDLFVCGEIIDGPYAGNIVDLRDISSFSEINSTFKGGIPLRPDDRLLKKRLEPPGQ